MTGRPATYSEPAQFTHACVCGEVLSWFVQDAGDSDAFHCRKCGREFLVTGTAQGQVIRDLTADAELGPAEDEARSA